MLWQFAQYSIKKRKHPLSLKVLPFAPRRKVCWSALPRVPPGSFSITKKGRPAISQKRDGLYAERTALGNSSSTLRLERYNKCRTRGKRLTVKEQHVVLFDKSAAFCYDFCGAQQWATW